MAGSSNNNVKFFTPRSSSATSFAFFAVISVLLMTVDHQMHMMEPVRSRLSVFSDTAYNVLMFPVAVVEEVAERFSSKNRLIEENRELKTQLIESNILTSRLDTVTEENRVLKQMLTQKENLPVQSGLFQVKKTLSDGFTQRFQIDGGSDDGLKVGMPVLSEKGLAGQLIHVGPLSSQVQLIQDKNQEVPVLFTTSGVRGIVRGSGEPYRLESRDLPFTDKIQIGEKVVTSGLDGVYPKGIAVGEVISVVPEETGAYVEVTVGTEKGIGDQDLVLVLKVSPYAGTPEIDTDPPEQSAQPVRRGMLQ